MLVSCNFTFFADTLTVKYLEETVLFRWQPQPRVPSDQRGFLKVSGPAETSITFTGKPN